MSEEQVGQQEETEQVAEEQQPEPPQRVPEAAAVSRPGVGGSAADASSPGRWRGLVGSGSGSIPSSQPKLRPAEASARCARSRIQPIASSGQTSWRSSVSKRTNSPIVMSPWMTARPPKNTTAAIDSAGR